MANIEQIMDTFINRTIVFFTFDVNAGVVENDIVDGFGFNYMKALGLSAPCKFDDIISRSMELGYATIVYTVGKSIEQLSCDGLLSLYENGENYIESCFYSADNKRYYRLVYILKKDNVTGHVFAYVICVDTTEVDKMRLDSLTESLESIKHKNDEIEDKLKIINCMAKQYMYIYSCDLETEIYHEIYAANSNVGAILRENGNINIAVKDLCKLIIKPEHVPSFAEFIDLSTLKERLGDEKYITQQFEGVYTGWLEAVIFPEDASSDGSFNKVIVAVRDINNEKEKETKLIYNSYVDDLTKLYNRKMYNENLIEYDDSSIPKNMVFISVDVNGLKVVNDTLGHDAGDELLKGVAECMKDSFHQYGRIYRLGGDEYAAIIYISQANLPKLINQFYDRINGWHGKLVDSISISLGYVTQNECKDKSIYDMTKIADSRMYKAKEEYYAQKGIDREGRQTAHAALCALYYKVLKINLTTNIYQIIHMDAGEFNQVNRLRYSLSEDIIKFAELGNVAQEDVEKYLKALSIAALKEYFKEGNECFSLFYRRKYNGGFKTVRLELVPADDYTEDNQSLFLYIRYIE